MTSRSKKDRELISFTKMHGIGNDYIYINCMESVPDRLPELAEEMSDRHFGVGGDGIVLTQCPRRCSACALFRSGRCSAIMQ